MVINHSFFGVPFFLLDHISALYSAGFAFFISILMNIRNKESARRNLTGSLVCSLFTLAIAASIEFLGVPDNAVAIIGASIGLLGVEFLKERVTAVTGFRHSGKTK